MGSSPWSNIWNIKMDKMIYSFKYPEIKKEDRRYAGIAGSVINNSGDWEAYLTPFEDQNVNNVESSACYVEANQAVVASLKEYIYGIKDENYSSRFNALLSSGTESGGDPLKAGLSIKKDGLIPQSMMDWKDIKSWSDFHSWKGVLKDECISKGQEEAREWDKKYYILSEKDDPLEVKYNNLRQGLKRSPVAISVYAWLERDGKYYKPKGVDDTHLVKVIKVNSDNSIVIRDTYSPYIKVLEANTDFDFSMYWILRKKSPEEILKDTQKSLIIILYEYIARLLKTASGLAGEIVEAVFKKPY